MMINLNDSRFYIILTGHKTNSFVIIEYKKGSSYSVVDQGYTYLSTMLNNKSDFVLEYNESTESESVQIASRLLQVGSFMIELD